jgi:PAS domain S-box-containing protein
MALATSGIVLFSLYLGFLLWDRRRQKHRAHVAEARRARLRRKFDALSAERQFLDQVLNAIVDPIFVKDAQHRFIYANEAQCRLSGRARWEVVGRKDDELFPKQQVDALWREDDRVLATGQENISEEQITDAAGALRMIVTKKSLYVDEDGRRYIVGISNDIAQRKEAVEAVRRRNAAWGDRLPESIAELAAPRSRQAEAIAQRKSIGAALRRYDDGGPSAAQSAR